jgi:hypothetical protein
MSFDIFLVCFKNQELATFPRALVEEIFGRHAIGPQFPLTDLDYTDGGGAIYGAEEDSVDGLMFNHCGGPTFYNAMLELADRTGSVIQWLAEGTSLVATRSEVMDHLPSGYLDDFGPACIVTTHEELTKAIISS